MSSESGCDLSVEFTAAARDFVQIGRPRLVDGCLHLDFGVLQWSKLVEIRKARNETKHNNLQLNVCAALADSYSCSQATAAREIEAHSKSGLCEGVRCTKQQS